MKFVSKNNLSYYTDKLKSWIKSRKIKASDFDSTGATAGQVPTADGSGGVSYQDPSGGGAEHLYWHTIKIEGFIASGTIPFSAYIIVLNQDSTVINGSKLTEILGANQSAEFIIVNYHFDTNDPSYYLLFIKYASATAISISYTTAGGTTYPETLPLSGLAVYDAVSQIL